MFFFFIFFLQREATLEILFASLEDEALLKWGLTLKEKNLLPEEQILSLKS